MPSLSAAVTAGLRRSVRIAAETRALRRFVRRHGMRLGAARFAAGETLDKGGYRMLVATPYGPDRYRNLMRL